MRLAPLSGHGVTGTDRLALICMHLAVGAVLIPVFAWTIPRASSAGDDPMKSDKTPPFSAQRQQAAAWTAQEAHEFLKHRRDLLRRHRAGVAAYAPAVAPAW